MGFFLLSAPSGHRKTPTIPLTSTLVPLLLHQSCRATLAIPSDPIRTGSLLISHARPKVSMSMLLGV
jgi:hypothetical protein